MRLRKAIAASLGAIVISCGSGTGDEVSAWTESAGVAPPFEAGVVVRVPVADGYSAPVASDLQSLTQAALADAALRTKLDRAQLTVVSAGAVTWSDGSLGCPQPGMMYTQALVPGYRIRIQAGAELLDYHASAGGTWVLCPAGRAIDPLPEERA